MKTDKTWNIILVSYTLHNTTTKKEGAQRRNFLIVLKIIAYEEQTLKIVD